MIKSSHSLKLFLSTFKDIISALLAKISWMIAVNEDILCTKILKAKYGSFEYWLRGRELKNSIWVWRKLLICVGKSKTAKENRCYFFNWLVFFLLLLQFYLCYFGSFSVFLSLNLNQLILFYWCINHSPPSMTKQSQTTLSCLLISFFLQ